MIRKNAPAPKSLVRCAIYTRKSTEEGLDQSFNTLDAQREAGEAYITSQKSEGWVCLPEHYDDGGFTGANMDRPALKRLLADIDAGQIDVVVVYKVDRLTRSLLDFTRMVEVFDRRNTSFISVTQQLNTTTSMGRLTLNMLLSFAQFEREIISERTRDKMSAARRKGKYVGGAPVLGYDLDTSGLRVNACEAAQVRTIFDVYLETGSLLPTVRELEKQNIRTKRWTTKSGKVRGGKPFDKPNLHNLLTNVIYLGQVRYREEIYEGEHAGIIERETFENVQRRLQQNSRDADSPTRNRSHALLGGLLRCLPCDCAMIPAHTSKGIKRYRYYTCGQAQKRGWETCPSKSVPAGEIEKYVIEQIRSIGRDPTLVAETIRQTHGQQQATRTARDTEQAALRKDLARHDRELRRLSLLTARLHPDRDELAQLADLQEQIRRGEQRLAELREETSETPEIDNREITQALREFGPLWDSLAPREQRRFLQLLIEQVGYDGRAGTISVTFRPTGLETFQAELRTREATT